MPGSEKIRRLEMKLAEAADLYTRIDLLHEIAWHSHTFDPQKARRLAAEAYALSSSGEIASEWYWRGLAGSLCSLIALDTDTGKYDQALSLSLEALDILEKLPPNPQKNSRIRIQLLGVVSWTYRCLGDYSLAARYALQALKLAQAVGERRFESGALNVLSVVYAESNDPQSALEIGLKVVRYHQEFNNVRGESIALNNLAMTYHDLGDGNKALETCRQSLRLAEENGLTGVSITALTTLGEVYLGLQDLVQAEATLQRALKLARAQQAGPDVLECLLNLGKVYHYRGNDQSALVALHEALSLSLAAHDPRSEFQSHQLLSASYERQGDLARALHHYKAFHRLKEQVLNTTVDLKLRNLQISHDVEMLKQESEIRRLKNVELQAALDKVKQLSGLLPICANCKKIRDDGGYWHDVAVYIRDHSEAEFSHGICPDCVEILYPGLRKKGEK